MVCRSHRPIVSRARWPLERSAPHAAASSDNESSAEENDPSHVTDENSRVRINQVIQDLMKAGKETFTYCDTTPLKNESRIQPPALDLGLIKLSTDALLFLDDSVLYGYLTSNDFLPCIASRGGRKNASRILNSDLSSWQPCPTKSIHSSRTPHTLRRQRRNRSKPSKNNAL